MRSKPNHPGVAPWGDEVPAGPASLPLLPAGMTSTHEILQGMINGNAPGHARDIEAEELETRHLPFPPGSEMLAAAHLTVWYYDSFTGRGDRPLETRDGNGRMRLSAEIGAIYRGPSAITTSHRAVAVA
ncbi:hypothetical protein MUK42_05568 [Musa troglodytarum]|uniref:Uncharacterized protein n=1 Tax=Musa troglodytarum TaxID=320322 RepID=A0A9E7FKB9_9LILI|nr:hypothetical protein MUK42_05568 [Musa troglodytarum]